MVWQQRFITVSDTMPEMLRAVAGIRRILTGTVPMRLPAIRADNYLETIPFGPALRFDQGAEDERDRVFMCHGLAFHLLEITATAVMPTCAVRHSPVQTPQPWLG